MKGSEQVGEQWLTSTTDVGELDPVKGEQARKWFSEEASLTMLNIADPRVADAIISSKNHYTVNLAQEAEQMRLVH